MKIVRLESEIDFEGFRRAARAAAASGMGADVAGLDPDQLRFMIRATRKDARLAVSYFTELLASSPRKLRAPVVSVVGSRDPGTDYYQERFAEWAFLSGSVTAVVLDEAGHFFMGRRAEGLAVFRTFAHAALVVTASTRPTMCRTVRCPYPPCSWWRM